MTALPATPAQLSQITALLFLIEREASYPDGLTRGQARTEIAALKRRARQLDLDPADAQITPGMLDDAAIAAENA
jgi:hypothetical protein